MANQGISLFNKALATIAKLHEQNRGGNSFSTIWQSEWQAEMGQDCDALLMPMVRALEKMSLAMPVSISTDGRIEEGTQTIHGIYQVTGYGADEDGNQYVSLLLNPSLVRVVIPDQAMALK